MIKWFSVCSACS